MQRRGLSPEVTDNLCIREKKKNKKQVKDTKKEIAVQMSIETIH